MHELSVRTRTSLCVISAPVIPEYLRSYIIKHKQQNDLYQSHSSILLRFQKLSMIISSIENWSSDISLGQRILLQRKILPLCPFPSGCLRWGFWIYSLLPHHLSLLIIYPWPLTAYLFGKRGDLMKMCGPFFPLSGWGHVHRHRTGPQPTMS